MLLRLLLALCLLSAPPVVAAQDVRVAVASNFGFTLEQLAPHFSSEHRLVVTKGSTGKIYAQIRLGAPFDVFLAADQERPRLLEEAGLAAERFTYATGELVLLGGNCTPIETNLRSATRIAIANPALAPYGYAAKQAVVALGLWNAVEHKIVLAENVGQTYTLFGTGNADRAFVAKAQIRQTGRTDGCAVPRRLHAPIRQDAVLLRDTPGARAFVEFLKGARQIIAAHGYVAD